VKVEEKRKGRRKFQEIKEPVFLFFWENKKKKKEKLTFFNNKKQL